MLLVFIHNSMIYWFCQPFHRINTLMTQVLDGRLTKRAHSKTRYTKKQVNELKQCMDPVNGPIYFMTHFFYIQARDGNELYSPYKFQYRLIDAYHNYQKSISLCARQVGKTTTAVGYLLWFAMFTADRNILIAAHKGDHTKEIINSIQYAYEHCPDHIRCGVTGYARTYIEFDNGTRIQSETTTEKTGRGKTIHLLYLDEFAFVRNTIQNDFWASISATLTQSKGKCIITSTPNSDEDQFAQIWRGANKAIDGYGNKVDIGANGFKAVEVKWREHPDRSEEWAREARIELGDEVFRREHECEFLIWDETLINSKKLAIMEGMEPLFKEGQVRWYKKPEKNHAYLVALDPSFGTGGDNAAIQVFELPDMIQVAEWMHNETRTDGQVRLLAAINQYIHDELKEQGQKDDPMIWYSIENNTLGEGALMVINEMGEEHIRGVFMSEAKRTGHVKKFRKGFNTTTLAKKVACNKLKNYIENDHVTINSKNLISELKTFIALGLSFKAKVGEKDDLVAATLLITRMSLELVKWDMDLNKKLKETISADDHVMPMPIFIS